MSNNLTPELKYIAKAFANHLRTSTCNLLSAYKDRQEYKNAPTPGLRILGFSLTTFDAAATYAILKSGLGSEANPLMMSAMQHVGITEALLIRQAIVLLVLAHPKLPKFCAQAIAVVYGIVTLLHLLLFVGRGI